MRYLAFSRWVRQVLIAAREDRGWTDKDIEAATGVKARTFHRWQSGDIGAQGPLAENVYKFADGMKVPRGIPANMLGWSGEFPVVVPEPEIPPDIREIIRRLRDPDFPEVEKHHIRATLAALVSRPRARRPPVGAAARGAPKE